jgi:hypothetical protein
MNIKCMSCGLVNWSTATTCRRCNSPVQAHIPPPAPPQVQRSLPPPVQAQRPFFQPPPHPPTPIFQQPQAPAFQQPPPAYQNPVQTSFPNRQPYTNPIGQQQAPLSRPGQQVPLPINRPGQDVSSPLNQSQQQNGAPYAANPVQPFPSPGNAAPVAPTQPLQQYPNGNQQPFANPQAPPNSQNQSPYQNYPQPQPYQNYPNAYRPQSPNGQPYVNPQQPYPMRSPYGTNPLPPNQQPYQMGYAPPQVYPGPYAPNAPYAPGRPYAPPPYTAPKSSLGPIAKIFIALVVIGGIIGFTILKTIVERERTESLGEDALTVKYLKVPNHGSDSIEGMRENFFSYLGKDRDNRFGFDEMQRQLFSGIDEIIYDKEKGEVLFLISGCSENDPDKVRKIIERYAIDPSRVYYGESFKPKAVSFTGKSKTGWTGHCPLVIPVDNIRINPYSAIEMRYKTATYKISAQELDDYMTDKSTFSGPMRIFSKDRARRELNVFGNHGAFVAKPNEPSLTRLSNFLITSGNSMTREGKIQSLLNFVSAEITYDDTEAKFKGEILKRPDETLLTRRGDCSSKTILMASLLEQIGEEYRLVYYLDHITVAVPQGAFNINNTLSFSREGRTWVIAETTVPGFIVGETAIENKGIFRNIQYIQRPGAANGISAFDSLKEIFLR